MNDVLRWLLDGPPWVEYRTRIDLLDQDETEPEVIRARQAMIDHPLIRGLVEELSVWPWKTNVRLSNAAYPMHKLVFLADIGMTAADTGITEIAEDVMSAQSPEGAFQLPSGSGWAWKACDYPSLLYALVKTGLAEDPRVRKSIDTLVRYSFVNGWPCVMSRDLQWYSEPGPYDDCCPVVNIIALKTLALLPEWQDSKAARDGTDTLLKLWEQRRTQRPNLFGMGKRFQQLKAPFVWYDILHLLEVLTQFPRIRDDKRLREMVKIIEDKADSRQRYTVESDSPGWEEWDFGQANEPSQWLTFVVHRILRRMAA
ncbi:MAG: hypothetical protein JW712_03615 [Dehalococcoidales bacterium]|nr:hypothetical protein [Dehalococcoidales bacterium]